MVISAESMLLKRIQEAGFAIWQMYFTATSKADPWFVSKFRLKKRIEEMI